MNKYTIVNNETDKTKVNFYILPQFLKKSKFHNVYKITIKTKNSNIQ